MVYLYSKPNQVLQGEDQIRHDSNPTHAALTLILLLALAVGAPAQTTFATITGTATIRPGRSCRR